MDTQTLTYLADTFPTEIDYLQQLIRLDEQIDKKILHYEQAKKISLPPVPSSLCVRLKCQPNLSNKETLNNLPSEENPIIADSMPSTRDILPFTNRTDKDISTNSLNVTFRVEVYSEGQKATSIISALCIECEHFVSEWHKIPLPNALERDGFEIKRTVPLGSDIRVTLTLESFGYYKCTKNLATLLNIGESSGNELRGCTKSMLLSKLWSYLVKHDLLFALEDSTESMTKCDESLQALIQGTGSTLSVWQLYEALLLHLSPFDPLIFVLTVKDSFIAQDYWIKVPWEMKISVEETIPGLTAESKAFFQAQRQYLHDLHMCLGTTLRSFQLLNQFSKDPEAWIHQYLRALAREIEVPLDNHQKVSIPMEDLKRAWFYEQADWIKEAIGLYFSMKLIDQ